MKMVLIGPVRVRGTVARLVALAVTMPDAASTSARYFRHQSDCTHAGYGYVSGAQA